MSSHCWACNAVSLRAEDQIGIGFCPYVMNILNLRAACTIQSVTVLIHHFERSLITRYRYKTLTYTVRTYDMTEKVQDDYSSCFIAASI